ncbi:MAG: STAS domain-containing protein, partial [Actinomycetota bacterium]|nr:STAS domain-containing protein [Actinomycetota bacterium]
MQTQTGAVITTAPTPVVDAPLVIVLPARFDTHETHRVTEAIADAAQGASVIVDCSTVRFMDEAAIQSLLDASLRCAERNGRLRLGPLSIAALVTLELTGSLAL